MRWNRRQQLSSSTLIGSGFQFSSPIGRFVFVTETYCCQHMTILLIQPPCVVSSQVTELYIHKNFKFSKSNCQALTPFFWSSSCKGVKILNMSAGIISRGPAATGDYISFSFLLPVSLSLLLIVSFSSKCCFNSRYILDRVIFLFINHFSALSFVKHFEWIHHMTCWLRLRQSSLQSRGPQATDVLFIWSKPAFPM